MVFHSDIFLMQLLNFWCFYAFNVSTGQPPTWKKSVNLEVVQKNGKMCSCMWCIPLARPPITSSLKVTDRSFSCHWSLFFNMPHLTCGTSFLRHFVNQFHLFVLISTYLPFLHFFYLSLFHSKHKNYLFGKSFLMGPLSTLVIGSCSLVLCIWPN